MCNLYVNINNIYPDNLLSLTSIYIYIYINDDSALWQVEWNVYKEYDN